MITVKSHQLLDRARQNRVQVFHFKSLYARYPVSESICDQLKLFTLNFFLKLKYQNYKIRVKSKICSCNFSQLSKKQIFAISTTNWQNAATLSLFMDQISLKQMQTEIYYTQLLLSLFVHSTKCQLKILNMNDVVRKYDIRLLIQTDG
ncbi:Hypothetical_protein [Hexamita inflata]|uniref:Hypothetical_protein n=1 Tax=Hexamita inflata TaxID=28002 RepID=A0ABP1HF56_9EUKA